jgi:riboflavin kinase/FMN adenylyltransferase
MLDLSPAFGPVIDIVWLDAVLPRTRRVALGQFDGVHLGHRQVIEGCDTVVTFEPHPQAVIAPDRAPVAITPLARKAELMSALGVEQLVVVPFDRERAGQSADEFVADVLVRRLQAREVSVGANFRFGHRAAGTPALLAGDARFASRVVPLLEVDGEQVSSTRIRRLLEAGEVDEAGRLLGAPVALRLRAQRASRAKRDASMATRVVFEDGVAVPAPGDYRCATGRGEAMLRVDSRQDGWLLGRERFLPRDEVVVELLERWRGATAGSST